MATPNSNADYWELKRSTQVKHGLLTDYLKRWASILSGGEAGTRKRTFHYVDGFAGRGRYNQGEPGSPIIAMDIGQELWAHRNGNFSLACYNVEQNPDHFEFLQREISSARPEYPNVESIQNFCGSFQDLADEILGLIPEREHTFVFVDPFGYRGVELKQILKFLERRRSEIFITFMSNYIGRYMTDPNRADAMDRIFDTGEWRRLAEKPTGSQQQGAVELYGKQLQKRGSEIDKDLYILPIEVESGDGSTNPYHLIHCSQHPKGRQAMEKSVGKVGFLHTQEPLFSQAPEIGEYMIEVLRESPDGLKALNLAGKVWLRYWYASWNRDFKEAIGNLEASNEAVVKTHDGRKRKTGLEDKDVISLRGS